MWNQEYPSGARWVSYGSVGSLPLPGYFQFVVLQYGGLQFSDRFVSVVPLSSRNCHLHPTHGQLSDMEVHQLVSELKRILQELGDDLWFIFV